MDALELAGGNEIRDFVAAKLKALVDSFSIVTVGHITRFVEPVSHTIGRSEPWRPSLRGETSTAPRRGGHGGNRFSPQAGSAQEKGHSKPL